MDIDLYVIRVGTDGTLKNSMPCFMCIEHMKRVNKKTAYRFKNIWYSNSDGNIICNKFNDLITQGNQHVSFRFRRN